MRTAPGPLGFRVVCITPSFQDSYFAASLFHNIHTLSLHWMQYTLKAPVYKAIW